MENHLVENPGVLGMKVVHITPYFPPCKGGISRFVSGLVEHTHGEADVHVVTREGEPAEGVYVISTGKGRFILGALQKLKDIRPDVIHCHSHWHMLAPAVVYKRLHRGVKIIFTFHTQPLTLKKGARSNVFGRLLSKCDAVTYVSKSLQDQVSDKIKIQATESVVHPGVQGKEVTEEQVLDFVKTHRIEGRKPILVFVGLLEWEMKVQGVKILLEAVERICDRYPDLVLILVGDGSRRREVEDVIENLNLSDSVLISGLIDNVFVPFALCDIYVHITLQEGLPQAVLEAMSMGKPVIASNIGGIPEVIKDRENGILVNPDVVSVSSAIEDLLGNSSSLNQLGERARRHVTSHFTWENTTRDFLELYTKS